VPPDQPVSWRWSLTPLNPGRQRLSTVYSPALVPIGNESLPTREVTVFSRGLGVRVLSFLGLSQAQAMLAGLIGLLFGSSLGLYALVVARPRRLAQELQIQSPNPDLAIELPAGLILNSQERLLLKALFQRYARLLIEQEFLSGYSGARAFLALPIRPDGRADAYTIAKLGERQSIHNEFETTRLTSRTPCRHYRPYPASSGDRLGFATRQSNTWRSIAGSPAIYLHRRAGKLAPQPSPGSSRPPGSSPAV